MVFLIWLLIVGFILGNFILQNYSLLNEITYRKKMISKFHTTMWIQLVVENFVLESVHGLT